VHPAAANGQQRDNHRQQQNTAERHSEKNEHAVLRVMLHCQKPGRQRQGKNQQVDEQKRPKLLPAGHSAKIEALFPSVKIRLSIRHFSLPVHSPIQNWLRTGEITPE